MTYRWNSLLRGACVSGTPDVPVELVRGALPLFTAPEEIVQLNLCVIGVVVAALAAVTIDDGAEVALEHPRLQAVTDTSNRSPMSEEGTG